MSLAVYAVTIEDLGRRESLKGSSGMDYIGDF